jgi:hypothetical protein
MPQIDPLMPIMIRLIRQKHLGHLGAVGQRDGQVRIPERDGGNVVVFIDATVLLLSVRLITLVVRPADALRLRALHHDVGNQVSSGST